MKNRDEYLRIEAEVARDTALRELSELKRQHERLQMAAAPFAKLHGENADVWALRAALDSTPAEPENKK